MNTFRRLLADKIESNGGYSHGYHDRYPIEYCVALDYVNLDVDHIYKVMCENQGYLPPPTSAIDWDEQEVWEMCQSDMCESLNDNEGYMTYGRDTANRFGLPYINSKRTFSRIVRGKDVCYYPAKLPLWKRDDPYVNLTFDVKFSLEGRGGKHLVVTEFEGRKLNMSSDSLAESIRGDNTGYYYNDAKDYPNKWCQRLLAMMHEWEMCFTSRIASTEMEYQAAFRLQQDLEPRADAWRKALAARRVVKGYEKMAQVMAGVLS